MYVSVCQYVCFSVCLSVWFCVSLSERQKCFAEPQTLMLPTLLNSPGIRKHFNSPLHFKPAALKIITNFELKPLMVYQIVPADSPPARSSPARPRSRPLARRPYHSSALRSPAGSPTRPLARPPARAIVNQTKQYLLD